MEVVDGHLDPARRILFGERRAIFLFGLKCLGKRYILRLWIGAVSNTLLRSSGAVQCVLKAPPTTWARPMTPTTRARSEAITKRIRQVQKREKSAYLCDQGYPVPWF